MSLDGLFVYALTQELSSELTGARINKIHQPNEHELVLNVRAKGTTYKWLLSAHPSYPRTHFTEQAFQNPMEPPMFCMLLRKHCESGIIESIRQVGLERIIHIDVKSRDELGDETTRRIIVEIMGRHSNIILMDPLTGMVMDSIHHVTPAVSRHRVVLPGRPYVDPPEQGKLDPFSITHDKFISLLDLNQGKLDKQLVSLFTGLSPLSAGEIVYRSGLPTRENLWNAFAGMMEQLEKGDFTPTIVEGPAKSVFHVVDIASVEGHKQTYTSVNECLDAFFKDKAEADAIKQKAADLTRFLQNERDKNSKKLEKLNETLKDADEADRFRIFGELLTANLYLLKKGDRTAKVINFYDEEGAEVDIPLDPQLTPSENAQRFFRKYNKAKSSVQYVKEQIKLAYEEIRYFETLLGQVETASFEDIEEIREELAEQGYLKLKTRKDRKKKANAKPVLTTFVSSEGYTLYVGKNNKQNDYLTTKLASSQDTWLHTKDIPGSHVVIKGTGFGEETLHEAAQLAAYFSKGKASSRVPVDYTLIKHVKKPNGSKPGYVIYDNQKTLFVTPEEATIKELEANSKDASRIHSRN